MSLVSRKDIKILVEKLYMVKEETGKVYPIANALPFCVLGKGNMKKVAEVSLGAKYDDGHCRLVVDPRGFIKPSYFIAENLGAYLEIGGAWGSEFLKKTHSLKFVERKCRDCSYLIKCKAGSRYGSKVRSGSYFKRDFFWGLCDEFR